MNKKLTASALTLAAAGVLFAGQAAVAAPALNTGVAPGGNFNLSVWELQEPIGSAGSPTTITPSRLKGATGFQIGRASCRERMCT